MGLARISVADGDRVAATARPPASGRNELLKVAIDLFATRSFAGTSIRDIAGAAGCSIANVYHHFASKEALWLAVLAGSVDDLPAVLTAAMAALSDDAVAGPLDRFERLVRAHVATSHRFPRESQILFIDEGRLSAASNAMNQQLQRAILRIYLGELQSLVDAGVTGGGDLKAKALNALGVVNWHLRWMKRGSTRAEQAAEAEAIVSFVLRAIDERRPPS